MKQELRQREILNTVYKCLKDYDQNLKNKKIMFVVEMKDKNLIKEEIYFPKSSYCHLTGVIILDCNGRILNSFEFYNLIKKGTITFNKYKIISRNNTMDLKLQVLPQLMKIDRMATMIGDFNNSNLYLQTKKIIGNVNTCMGFIKDSKSNLYIPNTTLKSDIRDITENTNKIVAILKKDANKILYDEMTYLKQNYKVADILKNEEITENIDLKKLNSLNGSIQRKIEEFLK